jgi:hypothetical protein
LIAEGNLSEGALALTRLIRGGFKKGCVTLYYSSTKYESILTVYWNGVGAAEMSFADPFIWEFSFLGVPVCGR